MGSFLEKTPRGVSKFPRRFALQNPVKAGFIVKLAIFLRAFAAALLPGVFEAIRPFFSCAEIRRSPGSAAARQFHRPFHFPLFLPKSGFARLFECLPSTPSIQKCYQSFEIPRRHGLFHESYNTWKSKSLKKPALASVLCAVFLGSGCGGARPSAKSLGHGRRCAFPGSMCGALLCGLFYQKTGNISATLAGETTGTGFLEVYPLARSFPGPAVLPFLQLCSSLPVFRGGGTLTAANCVETACAELFSKH